MRGNIFGVVAITVCVAFVPLVLDVGPTLGSTGQQIQQLITTAAPILYLSFLVVALTTVIVFLSTDSF